MIQRAKHLLRDWRHGRVSLRTRLTGAFTLVVVGGTAVSTLFGSRIITNALLNEARSRAVQGVNAAQAIYAEQLQATAVAVERAAADGRSEDAPSGRPSTHWQQTLVRREPQLALDFARSIGSMNVQNDPCLSSPSFHRLVQAGTTRAVSATEALSPSCLQALQSSGAAMAGGRLDPRGYARDGSALALVAAVPLTSGDPRGSVLYGGIVLDRRTDLVDAMNLLVYGSGTFEGRQIGSVSIFADDQQIAATPNDLAGVRVLGGAGAPDVVSAVLRSGRAWDGRTRIGDDWYVAAAQPVRDFTGSVVGILQVGTLEAPILAVRTHVMLTFLVVCLFGLIVVFGMTYVITRRTIAPIEAMAAATREIATGDLGVRVAVAGDDEIGDLARAFNAMLSSLEAMKRELEAWGHTLEEKVRERTDQLIAVQASMARAQKLASIGRLAAGVAHSINNPLGGILSLSMLAAEDCKDPALLSDLNTISTQAMRCREIVKGLLEFSHQSDARVAATDVNAIVADSVGLLERQSAFHNVTIVRRLAAGLPPVLVNPGQLQDAVTNLLVNAVDAMDRGGTLTVETEYASRPAEVLIRIADTGCGISEEHMPYLFEPFFTTKRVGKGTGLGLAITHGVVTKAGGRIEVASSPAGTTFTLHFPGVREEFTDDQLAGAGARESAGGR